jgi:hypothetical protein
MTTKTKLTAEQRKQKAVRRRWIKALESGTYKQTIGKLARDSKGARSYCCLGVLCDLAVKAKIISETERDIDGNPTFDDEYGVLPESVRDWVGLATDTGSFDDVVYVKTKASFGGKVACLSLLDLNDDGRKKFKTIAKIIAAEPAGLVA